MSGKARTGRSRGRRPPWKMPACVARAKVSKILQAELRAAVLRCQPVVCRKDREVAGAAHGIAATGVERAVAVVAGGERALICAAIISGCAMARPLFGHT